MYFIKSIPFGLYKTTSDIDVTGVTVITRVLVYSSTGIVLFCVVFAGILNHVTKTFEDGNVSYKKNYCQLCSHTVLICFHFITIFFKILKINSNQNILRHLKNCYLLLPNKIREIDFRFNEKMKKKLNRNVGTLISVSITV